MTISHAILPPVTILKIYKHITDFASRKPANQMSVMVGNMTKLFINAFNDAKANTGTSNKKTTVAYQFNLLIKQNFFGEEFTTEALEALESLLSNTSHLKEYLSAENQVASPINLEGNAEEETDVKNLVSDLARLFEQFQSAQQQENYMPLLTGNVSLHTHLNLRKKYKGDTDAGDKRKKVDYVQEQLKVQIRQFIEKYSTEAENNIINQKNSLAIKAFKLAVNGVKQLKEMLLDEIKDKTPDERNNLILDEYNAEICKYLRKIIACHYRLLEKTKQLLDSEPPEKDDSRKKDDNSPKKAFESHFTEILQTCETLKNYIDDYDRDDHHVRALTYMQFADYKRKRNELENAHTLWDYALVGILSYNEAYRTMESLIGVQDELFIKIVNGKLETLILLAKRSEEPITTTHTVHTAKFMEEPETETCKLYDSLFDFIDTFELGDALFQKHVETAYDNIQEYIYNQFKQAIHSKDTLKAEKTLSNITQIAIDTDIFQLALLKIVRDESLQESIRKYDIIKRYLAECILALETEVSKPGGTQSTITLRDAFITLTGDPDLLNPFILFAPEPEPEMRDLTNSVSQQMDSSSNSSSNSPLALFSKKRRNSATEEKNGKKLKGDEKQDEMQEEHGKAKGFENN